MEGDARLSAITGVIFDKYASYRKMVSYAAAVFCYVGIEQSNNKTTANSPLLGEM